MVKRIGENALSFGDFDHKVRTFDEYLLKNSKSYKGTRETKLNIEGPKPNLGGVPVVKKGCANSQEGCAYIKTLD